MTETERRFFPNWKTGVYCYMSLSEWSQAIDPGIQLFRQRLSKESVEAYPTMPKGSLGNILLVSIKAQNRLEVAGNMDERVFEIQR